MESAEARRVRLKALREAAAGAEEADVQSSASEEPVLKFRNYAVKDQKNIEHTTVDAAQAPEFVAPVIEPSVVQEVQGEVSRVTLHTCTTIAFYCLEIPTYCHCMYWHVPRFGLCSQLSIAYFISMNIRESELPPLPEWTMSYPL